MVRSLGADGGGPTNKENQGSETARPQETGQATINYVSTTGRNSDPVVCDATVRQAEFSALATFTI